MLKTIKKKTSFVEKVATKPWWRCIPAVHHFVRLSVCLSPKSVQKGRFSQKNKQFRAMVSIDDLLEVLHALFKEPIIGCL